MDATRFIYADALNVRAVSNFNSESLYSYNEKERADRAPLAYASFNREGV
jgi:hypothetical protein